MKTCHVLGCALALSVGATLRGQYYPQYYPQYFPRTVQPAPSAPSAVAQAPEQIDQLLSPIALYADPLVGVILPAATDWPELQAADQFLRSYPGAAVDSQPWDDAVKALAHYPEVVGWMDDNIAWTQQLGAAFVEQPADVMDSIQRLRRNALANGILVSTPEQQVIDQGGLISILPAQPNVVYLPAYDPQILYAPRAEWRSAPMISFSYGVALGPWLAYDFDWGRRSIWIDRSRYAYTSRGARVTAPVGANRGRREEWHPRAEVAAQVRSAPAPAAQVVRPPAFDARRWAQTPAPAMRREPPLTPTGRMPAPVMQPPVRREERVMPVPAAPEPVRQPEQPPAVNQRPIVVRPQVVDPRGQPVRPPQAVPAPPPQAQKTRGADHRRIEEERRAEREDERDRDRRP